MSELAALPTLATLAGLLLPTLPRLLLSALTRLLLLLAGFLLAAALLSALAALLLLLVSLTMLLVLLVHLKLRCAMEFKATRNRRAKFRVYVPWFSLSYLPGIIFFAFLSNLPGLRPARFRRICAKPCNGERLLRFMDGHLGDRTYLAADHPTIADLACYSYVAHAPEGGISLDGYPVVGAWLRRIEALPQFVPMSACPLSQG